MNNYEFCAKWVQSQAQGESIRVLDYGCGAGEIIKILRKNKVNAFGCDVFYEGGDYSSKTDPAFFERGIIKKMASNTIPFESGSFDFVTNNQVLEHVDNLDEVLAEIQRVLKPGGVVLSLFPDKGVWREGHCGIPFLHWFPKKSRARVYYAAVFRLIGFGYFKDDRTAMSWSRDTCEWLDQWTFYKARQYINCAYSKYFCEVQHFEDYWLHQRLRNRYIIIAWLPVTFQRLVVRKLGGMIFTAKKPI